LVARGAEKKNNKMQRVFCGKEKKKIPQERGSPGKKETGGAAEKKNGRGGWLDKRGELGGAVNHKNGHGKKSRGAKKGKHEGGKKRLGEKNKT